VTTNVTSLEELVTEAERQLAVCDSCRYCEGYCAVFPALEDLEARPTSLHDLAYLAHLCHDCRACYQACMYSPPHEFRVNIPVLMSTAREESYAEFGRPQVLARILGGGPLSVFGATLIGIFVFAFLAVAADWTKAGRPTGHAFYDVIPYAAMLIPMLLLSAGVLITAVWSFRAFLGGSGISRTRGSAWARGLRDVGELRWMRGAGDDCYYPSSERTSSARRVLHHFVVAGFALAFLSTALAAFYHHALDEEGPYAWLSPVVLAGFLGGILLTIGASGLLRLRLRSTHLHAEREASLNLSFIVALDAVAVSGLLLLVFRTTQAVDVLLVLHLGTVFALYVTAPYGKFIHAIYRTAAVLRYNNERRDE
jgi:citrate/tricarballylate utilization protein